VYYPVQNVEEVQLSGRGDPGLAPRTAFDCIRQVSLIGKVVKLILDKCIPPRRGRTHRTYYPAPEHSPPGEHQNIANGANRCLAVGKTTCRHCSIFTHKNENHESSFSFGANLMTTQEKTFAFPLLLPPPLPTPHYNPCSRAPNLAKCAYSLLPVPLSPHGPGWWWWWWMV
jgi:hypothetical protein